MAIKCSNFQIIEIKNEDGYIFDRVSHATVDVETGFWFWKKTQTCPVFKKGTDIVWRFTNTGEFSPGSQIEQLAWAYEAQTGRKL